MNHNICDACETVNHCSKHGCIPLQPLHNYTPPQQTSMFSTNLTKKQIAYTWVQAQLLAIARQHQLNAALQAIHPDNTVLDLDCTNSYYTDLVRELVGEEAWDWVTWWCWECDYGSKPHTFILDGDSYDPSTMTFLQFWELTCE